MFSIIQAAGWPIWLLLIASVVAVAIIIERFLFLRRKKIVPEYLLDEVIRLYQTQKMDKDVLQKLAENSHLGQVLAAVISHRNLPREAIETIVEETGRKVVFDLERFLTTLGTIASLAPLMGLFGTVIGMIEIFASQNALGSNPAQLARGISIALYNTAFGLAVAMPALICYRHFRGLVNGLIIDMEQRARQLLNIVHPS